MFRFNQRTKHPSSASEDNDQESDEEAGSAKPPMVSTDFAEWCASYFAQSVMKVKFKQMEDFCCSIWAFYKPARVTLIQL